MGRPPALVVLAVFGAGVFLSGLELLITAVALPSILEDLADPAAGSAWVELRKASWIINGYLVVYVLMMPLAGRMADVWGARRPLLAALGLFTVGSGLAGIAQTMDQLIAARLVQGIGGGILVPVGTAAAAHLFGGLARPRALGVIAALTFLGMAAGPFLSAAILGNVRPEAAIVGAGVGDPLLALFAPAWRWVFLVNVPIGLVAILIGWAATSHWDTPRRAGRLDLPGAIGFGLALLALLLALTLIGSDQVVDGAVSGQAGTLVAAAIALALVTIMIVRAWRHPDPFLDPRLFTSGPFSAAALISLLTGYAFATAIIGGAVFVDRVLYGGPDDQRLALGALAGATAIGALVGGLAVRRLSLRAVTLIGIAPGIVGLWAMSRWTSETSATDAAAALATFGLGFGLTVTPRSAAAVEAAGRAAFGVASAVVTVARTIGMAIGLAVLTAYGSTTIDRLVDQVYATPDAYLRHIPEWLRDRPLRDPLVVDALESWASREAAGIMVGLFIVAGLVMAAAVAPSLALGRPRMLAPASDQAGAPGRAGGAAPR